MPLRIWLPLNGNDTNQGISGGSATTVTAGSFVDGGKIANKCMSNGVRSIPYTYTSTNKLSIALWVKPNSATAWTDMFGWGTGANRIEVSATGGTEYRYYLTSGNGLMSSGTVISNSIANGEWSHFAMVADGTNVKFYVNGSLVKTATQSNTVDSTFGTSKTVWVGGYPDRGTFNSYINDFRVYDHAISVKEVKELSQGLFLHIPLFGDGYPGIGKNIVPNAWKPMTAYSMGQWYTTMLYDTDFWGLAVGDQYTYRIKLTAPSDRGIKAHIQFYTDGNNRTSLEGNTIAAGQTGYSTITSVLTSGQRSYSRMELLITTANSSISTTCTVYVGELKLERGDHATEWSPGSSSADHDADYNPWKNTTGTGIIVTATGHEPTLVSSGPRYGMSAHFTGGSSGEAGDYLEYAVQSGLTKATWMTWIKLDDTQAAYPSLDIKKGDPTGNLWLSVNTESNALWSYYSGIYNRARSTMLSPGDWYHIAFTWDSGVTRWYLNGEAQGSAVDMSSKSTTWPTSTRSIGTSYAGTSWSGSKLNSSLCDMRMYATVLSEADIRSIAKAPTSFTNNGEVHCGAVVERTGVVSVEKSGFVKCDALSELYGRFDNHVRLEPDGSAWVRIVHHADPTSYLFSSSDTFSTWVYKDARRFFHGKMCDYTDRWEFMIIQKGDSSASTLKYRWVQIKNPNTAVWADVAASTITKNTGSGYSDFSTGGLYKINSNTFYCANNGTQGNWWGAVGAWGSHQGGIPAWGSVIVKDGGFEDLYIRIDGGANWSFPVNDRVSIIKTDNSLTNFGIVET